MVLKTKLSPLGGGNQAYKKDFVVFESSTPGTYTFEIKKAQFEVTGSGATVAMDSTDGLQRWRLCRKTCLVWSGRRLCCCLQRNCTVRKRHFEDNCWYSR